MLRWKTRPRGEQEAYVVLEGELTERESLVGLHIDAARVVLNLARVRYVNSEGSRRLLQFVKHLAEHQEVVAELCSPAVVDVLNFVPLMASHMSVRSVIVPTECAVCEHEGDVRVVLPETGELPAISWPVCNECGGDMEPSVPIDRYFAFLADYDRLRAGRDSQN